MALSAVRNCFTHSKVAFGTKLLVGNSLAKPLFSIGHQNAKIVCRSFSHINRIKNMCPVNKSKISAFNGSYSTCSMHTKGDEELGAFLHEEIETEKKTQKAMPTIEGFEIKFSGAEVELSRKMEGETIVISANVNHSVDTEEPTSDFDESKEPPPAAAELKATPDFRVNISKHGKTLSFLCSYQEISENESEEYADLFQISELSMYEKDLADATYTVAGDIMDGYLYDLLMNFLEERGITNEFVSKLVILYTHYEHQLYINLLKDMKSYLK